MSTTLIFSCLISFEVIGRKLKNARRDSAIRNELVLKNLCIKRKVAVLLKIIQVVSCNYINDVSYYVTTCIRETD